MPTNREMFRNSGGNKLDLNDQSEDHVCGALIILTTPIFLPFLRFTPFATRLCSYSQQRGKSIFPPLDFQFSHCPILDNGMLASMAPGDLKSTAAMLVLTFAPPWKQFQAICWDMWSGAKSLSCLSWGHSKPSESRVTLKYLKELNWELPPWLMAATWGSPREINPDQLNSGDLRSKCMFTVACHRGFVDVPKCLCDNK